MVFNAGSSNGVSVRNDSISRPRKLSLQVVFPKPSLSGYAAATENSLEAQLASVSRRKLSQVTHKLSTTIGWRAKVSHNDVVTQARNLCGRYLRYKLRSCGPVHRNLGLQRLIKISNDLVLSGVGEQLLYLTGFLERQNPHLFRSVMDCVGVQSLDSETSVLNLFQAVSDEILRQGISWGRIVALYCVAGGLALDCVRLGHPEYVLNLVQGMGSVIEGDVAAWIVYQGGWGALPTRFRATTKVNISHIIMSGVFIILFLMFPIYWITYC